MPRGPEHLPSPAAIGVPPAPASDWVEAMPGPCSGPTVWRVDLHLDPDDSEPGAGLLSPEEQARADRFRRAEDRQRYRQSHAALRLVLGHTLDAPPLDLRFATSATGKPHLIRTGRPALHFNLSHSGRHALIGIASESEIGVDVEAIRPIGDPLAIARPHFHPDEITDLTRLPAPDRDAAFFRCWTRKEAVVKALGTGLSLPLDHFSVSVPPAAGAVRWMRSGPAGWSLCDLPLGPDAVGTVAIPLPNQGVRRLRLPTDWAARTGLATIG